MSQPEQGPAPLQASQQQRRHGRRLRALGDACHRTVKYALRPLDYEQFAAQFPTLGEAVVSGLYDAYKQVRGSQPGGRAGYIPCLGA